MVGPGVLKKGRFGETFSDHTDIRPTILLLAGLEDDYAHDGRVLFEALSPLALPIGSAQGGPKAARYPSSGAGRQGGCEEFFRADKFRCNSTYQPN